MLFPLNIRTILIAHIMFNISFVVVTVKAKAGQLPAPSGRGRDGPRRERVDHVLEGHVPPDPAGHHRGRIAGIQPIDRRLRGDRLHSGQTETFPLYIYGSQLRGIPVQVNVVGTIIFVSAVLLVLMTTLWQRRVAARDYGAGI